MVIHSFSIKSDENLNFGKILESWEILAENKTLYGQIDDALIGGLRPVAFYQVKVFAENEMGRCKEGRVLQAMTNKKRQREVVQFPASFHILYYLILVKIQGFSIQFNNIIFFKTCL